MVITVVCSGSKLRVADTKKCKKLICKGSNVVLEQLDSLTEVSERRILSKLRTILHTLFISCWTATGARSTKDSFHHDAPHHRKSFIPVEVKL